MTRTRDDDKDQQHDDQQQTEQPKEGGLSPEQEFVLVQLASLDSRNDELLADVLRNYPDLRVQILEYANANFGNTMVQKAIARVDGTFEAEQLALMEQQDADTKFMEDKIVEETEQQTTTELSSEQQAPVGEQAQQVDAVDEMKPGDEQMLAATLEAAPQARDQVIEKATEVVGADTVEQAIEVQVEQQQQVPEELAVEAEPIPEHHVAAIVADPKAAEQEAWAARAREYNYFHSAMVDQFIEIAGSELRLPDGSVDPTVIVAWQQANDVQVDGRVGAATVAAARAGAKKMSVTEAVVAAPEEEAAPADSEP